MVENIDSHIKSLFDFVRIVDPISNNIVDQECRNNIGIKCYKMWNNKGLCKNCIGARAYNYDDKSFVKIKCSDDNIYLVMAKVIKYKNRKYILFTAIRLRNSIIEIRGEADSRHEPFRLRL